MPESKDIGTSSSGAPIEDKRLIRARQRAIGRELKRYFDDVVEETVPEDFNALLRKIDGAEPETTDGNSGEDDKTP